MNPPILSESPPRRRLLEHLRPSRVDRYLLGEAARGFLAAGTILLIVLVGGAMADFLAKVARGTIPADLLFTLVGLRTIGSLPILLPLAALLGVLLAWSRLWRESEMAVLQASGLDVAGQLRPLVLFAGSLVLMQALFALWLGPAAERHAWSLREEASRSLLVAGLEPGRFVGLPGRDGVIHVGGMSADGTRFSRMFIETEHLDEEEEATRIDVITAARGFLYHDADGVGRHVALEEGFRVEGRLGSDDFRLMRFARNDIRLPDSAGEQDEGTLRRILPTRELLARRDEPMALAELHWRLAAPFAVPLLVLLALPLARTAPRDSRHARVLVALLAWLLYYNLLLVGRIWLGQGRLAPALGLWWVHLLAAAPILWWFWRSGRLPRRRTRGAR